MARALRALVSIGTNSTRLLILDGDAVAVARSVGTRLGRGLDRDGRLDPAAAHATLETIDAYIAEVRDRGATVDAIATSALRRAQDAPQFSDAVRLRVGVEPRIISGDEEAAYSFLGATFGTRSDGRLGVLDVGGGSTELAVGRPGTIERTISLEIGAVRLSERVPSLLGERALDVAARVAIVRQAREAAQAVLAPLHAFAGFDRLVAVGGTAFTAGAMIARDPTRDGVALDRVTRRRLIDDLLARDIGARRAMAQIRPQRADILPAGLIVIDVACDALGVDELRVSHADLLAGYLRSDRYRALTLPGTDGMARKEDRMPPGSNHPGMG